MITITITKTTITTTIFITGPGQQGRPAGALARRGGRRGGDLRPGALLLL